MYRQGDVLIVPVDAVPALTIVKNGRQLVLAEGEATGHAHTVPASKGSLGIDAGGVMYLTIDELTEVRHQEHAAIPLAPGRYRVTRQREYTPERIVNVAD